MKFARIFLQNKNATFRVQLSKSPPFHYKKLHILTLESHISLIHNVSYCRLSVNIRRCEGRVSCLHTVSVASVANVVGVVGVRVEGIVGVVDVVDVVGVEGVVDVDSGCSWCNKCSRSRG